MSLAIKFLDADGRGPYSGHAWPLPRDGKPGRWVHAKGDLSACENGIHAASAEQAPHWIRERAFLIELGGEITDADGKLLARRGRLLRELDFSRSKAVEFACDCAERVLPLFERERPDDHRPRKAIEAARAWAEEPSASYASYAASAAYAYADAAANAYAAYVYAADAAADAYAAYAYDAAYAAYAADAAYAARAAERTWQAERLLDLLGVTPQEREGLWRAEAEDE